MSCRLKLHLDASATMCLVNRRGLGKAKHVDMQNLWIQEGSKSGGFTAKKVDTSQRRHKDSDVRRDSHITAELGAKAVDYSDDWTCFTCASNAVLSERKREVRRGRDGC